MKREMRVAMGGVMGMVLAAASAGASRAFPTPPTVTVGKFSPDPVEVNRETLAKLSATAQAPVKLHGESQATMTWSWKVDKVQLKGKDGAYFSPAPKTYEVTIPNTGANDPNATLVFEPRLAGEWKVTVHAEVIFRDISGGTWTGNSAMKDAEVKAVEKGAATTQK